MRCTCPTRSSEPWTDEDCPRHGVKASDRRCEDAEPCPGCSHPTGDHSREPDIGCLHERPSPLAIYISCPCLRPGTSEADQ